MIRFSSGTFVRHAGGRSLLWRPWTGVCVVADGAEPFLKHVGWAPRGETEIVAEIAADFGMRPEEIAGDFGEFLAPLVVEGLVESLTQSPQCGEAASRTLREENNPKDANFDALANMMNDTKLGGVVGCDETYELLSFKGNHKHSFMFQMPRKSRKRGGRGHCALRVRLPQGRVQATTGMGGRCRGRSNGSPNWFVSTTGTLPSC